MSTPEMERKRRMRVGAFLVLSILLLVVVVFVLGRAQGLLVRKVRLNTAFENISGLTVGAPVRLGGLDIGLVESVGLADDLHDRRVRVVLGIERRFLGRIRADSVARLTSKGLLGDSIINITVGSADAATVADGATLRAEESENVAELATELRSALAAVKQVSGQIDRAVARLVTDDFSHDVGRIAHATANVMEEAGTGGGLVHTLLTDRKLARSAEQIVADAERAVGRVDRLLASVEKGGAARDAVDALAQLRSATSDIAAVAAELRRGDGLLHSLVYDKQYTQMLADLGALAKTLRRVGDDVEAGRGTVGGLLRDPTVYEDLKVVLGNVKRNRPLRTLVRYTIKQDGLTGKEKDK